MAFDMTDYVDVKHRLQLALLKYPTLRIVEDAPELIHLGERIYIQCAVTVFRDETDALPMRAYCWEVWPGRTPFTKDSEQPNGATSALGRALGYMGFGIDKSIASSNEVLGRQEATDDRNKVISVARPTPVLDGPRAKELGSARLSAREQTDASTSKVKVPSVVHVAGEKTNKATDGQITLLTQMCAERGLDFDPAAPMTYGEAKEMFLAIKPIPKAKS